MRTDSKTAWLALLGTLVATACSATPPGGDGAAPEEPAPIEEPWDDVADPGTDVDSPDEIAKNLTLRAVSFKNVGRHGDALRVAVKGNDTRKETSGALVRFLDEADQPVIALDTDWDGIADSAERRFRFEESTIGQESFMGEMIVSGVFPVGSKIAKVEVALEDEVGGRSGRKRQTISLQAVRGESEACDVKKVADRCQEGMSCTGEPAACTAGVAPTLARVGYFGGASPRMIFQGTEPDEDVKSIAIEFLDASGTPTSVNLGSEDAPEMSSGLSLDAKPGQQGGAFVLTAVPSVGFTTLAPRIAATVSDDYGRTSARVVAAATSRTARGFGQACDPHGFDACAATTVCAPGLASAQNKCTSAEVVRSTKCKDGPTLNPGKGVTRAFGRAEGVSLWDPPTGCVSPEAIDRPEATVALVLDSPASSLVITTALPETESDTVLYVLPGCPGSSGAALACNDDTIGYSSTLTLQNVPAGTYTIVVDSVHPRGGRFGVSVEAK